jgi:uncharacterized membrane protein
MKRKFYVPLLILLPLPMAITIPFMVTSCSSNDIKMQITDETRYDSIIQPAPAQTVTTEQELLELSRVYLNNPNRVAKD